MGRQRTRFTAFDFLWGLNCYHPCPLMEEFPKEDLGLGPIAILHPVQEIRNNYYCAIMQRDNSRLLAITLKWIRSPGLALII